MIRRALDIAIIFALLVVVTLFVVQAFPGLIGAEHALVVQSGSMAPAITTGSVVFVQDTPVGQIEEGDVITYRDDGGNLVTHRVHEKYAADNSLRFVTKGDNNENPDPEPVYRDNYVGEVWFSVPIIGYIVAFGQTTLGWLVLVVLPMTILVISELYSLYMAGIEDVNPQDKV